MKITIRTIPHKLHRYPTIGDWTFYDNNPEGLSMDIAVSDMENWGFELLIALHEMVEAVMCKSAGVTPEMVDAFDMEFEKNRKPGDFLEPGYAKDAPYRKQHLIAEGIEKIVAAELGVNWAEYEKACDALFPEG